MGENGPVCLQKCSYNMTLLPIVVPAPVVQQDGQSQPHLLASSGEPQVPQLYARRRGTGGGLPALAQALAAVPQPSPQAAALGISLFLS